MGDILEDFKVYWKNATDNEFEYKWDYKEYNDIIFQPNDNAEGYIPIPSGPGMQDNSDYQEKFINFFTDRGEETYHVKTMDNNELDYDLEGLINEIKSFYSTLDMDYKGPVTFYIK